MFHILTIIISIVVFLGLFIYTYVVYTENKNTLYPPDIANCPDFWEVNADGTCKIPQNGRNTGNLKGVKTTLYEYDDIRGIPNLSYLSKYHDPGSRPKKASIPTRPTANLTPNPLESREVIRYSLADIPYGYDPYNPTVVNFTDMGWSSYGDPYCAIKQWANINGVNWDGMVSYNKC
jgi:hypothetical protein